MKRTKSGFVLLALACAFAAVPPTLAAPDKAAATPAAAGDGNAAVHGHPGTGTVKAMNAKAGKVTLSHGPIPGLQWPAMTMEFAVADKEALSRLKPGQKVTFEVVEKPKGRYVVTRIVPIAK